MSSLFRHFPQRVSGDRLDVAPLLHARLVDGRESLFLAFASETFTNRRIAQRVAELQAWLSREGLAPGDRVALMMGNSPDHVALIFALILSGLVWVPVNTRLKSAGLQYLQDHCRPEFAVVDAGFHNEWGKAQEMAQHRCEAREIPAAVQGRASAPLLVVRAPAETLCLIYTSGTTGAPKAVMFTHRMLRIASEAALQVADVRAGGRIFLWEPLCHIGGAQMLLAPALDDVQLHMVPAFSASRFAQQVGDARATHLHYLGGIMDILLQQPGTGPVSAPSLRVAWGAGLSRQAWGPARERIAPEIRECYGMTECSSFATVNASGKPGSIGKPLPWIRAELLDANGQAVAPGQHGEIVLSSEVEGAFLAGYLDNPAASASALRGGKLYTGDFGWQAADGDLYFVGRATDSMRVRGENVSAWEVERVISGHPEVRAIAAVGVEGEIGEQEILAYVQWRDGRGDLASLARWARERLASFQVPRYWSSVDVFELTPSERIRKHLLPRDLRLAWDSAAAA